MHLSYPFYASMWNLPQASEHARNVDHVFWALMGISLLICLVLLFLVLQGVLKKKPSQRGFGRVLVKNRWKIETTWMLIPFFIFIALYIWGARFYLDIFDTTKAEYTVYVTGRQWMWQSYYDDGYSEHNTLHLAKDVPVRLIISSEDVIHSLFIPAFRVKQDAVPGKDVQITITPTREGKYRLLCAEYCGTDHSLMNGFVYVQSQEDFARWQETHDRLPNLAEKGKMLFRKHGCSGCHNTNSSVHAPALADLYGSRVKLNSGQIIEADMGYLRDSILLPGKDMVAGYQNIMPTYKNELSEAEIISLLAYLQSLSKDMDE